MESDGQFALIMDGTQDINGTEQISVCLRHVDDSLVVYEDFIGLYSVESTTGGSLAKVAKDVVLRLGLSMGNARVLRHMTGLLTYRERIMNVVL